MALVHDTMGCMRKEEIEDIINGLGQEPIDWSTQTPPISTNTVYKYDGNEIPKRSGSGSYFDPLPVAVGLVMTEEGKDTGPYHFCCSEETLAELQREGRIDAEGNFIKAKED